jgi:splicing factor 3B subunit 4
MSAAIEQKNQDATCYVGNLDEKVNEELLWELMLQAGPIVSVFMPKDKVSGKHLGYGFAEYRTEEDAEYAIKVLNMVKVYGKPIKVNKASQDKKALDVGANIFIGNLDSVVDEKLLYDTFSAFGGITQTPKIMLDPVSGASKGYAFISYDSFEASDLSIECMNGQYLCNRPIIVQYAFKKETPGERHGSQAERILAASQPQRLRPNTGFAGGGGAGDPNAGGGMMPPAIPGMMGMSGMQGMQGMQAFQQEGLYMQYAAAANPLLMQQMGAYGFGMPPGAPNMVPPPLPTMPVAPPMMPHYMHGANIPPPPPPPPSF